jgi:hypothetical protein
MPRYLISPRNERDLYFAAGCWVDDPRDADSFESVLAARRCILASDVAREVCITRWEVSASDATRWREIPEVRAVDVDSPEVRREVARVEAAPRVGAAR